MEKIKVTLNITHDEIHYSGWFRYGEYGNTIKGESMDELENNVRADLKKHCQIENVTIDRRFDVSDIFGNFDFINVSAFARYIDLNESLLRQYKSGAKMPTAKQLSKIVMVFRGVADRMNKIALAFDGKPVLDSDWHKSI
ncbi:hypothetical protein KXQ82_15510 [Mucilaginibacter sp. HMF5004]|uniref:hypothetical protein n=1 Tax=Mucilaginibacter rivuli TaxID=2857527 RepID=UPI001C5EA01B|nr:hypothetical protein [Mucilaginibacter rivuli]MBW4891132.1 hypothetical protein [Mucilaginibacter rivuli]